MTLLLLAYALGGSVLTQHGLRLRQETGVTFRRGPALRMRAALRLSMHQTWLLRWIRMNQRTRERSIVRQTGYG